jgi:hypothetical protein
MTGQHKEKDRYFFVAVLIECLITEPGDNPSPYGASYHPQTQW